MPKQTKVIITGSVTLTGYFSLCYPEGHKNDQKCDLSGERLVGVIIE